MVRAKGLPTLFVTLSMAETKWVHLTEILRHTDNRDINPTNRPFHVYVFYATISFIKKKDYGTTVTLVDGNVSVNFFLNVSNFKIVVQPIYILCFGLKLRLMK